VWTELLQNALLLGHHLPCYAYNSCCCTTIATILLLMQLLLWLLLLLLLLLPLLHLYSYGLCCC